MIDVTVQYLLERQVDRVLAALMPGNALVVRTMLETGLRVGDVLKLNTAQLKNSFWVTESKTGKRRHVGMRSCLIDDIRREAGDAVWAFPGVNPDKPRTRQTVWKDVKRAARAFRMPQNVGTHSFRKVYAVELMKKYGDFRRVGRALNHCDPTVTAVYAMADKLLEEKLRRRA